MRLKLSKNITRKFSDPRKSKRYKKAVTFLQKRPFVSFFVAIGLLFLIIIAGNVLASLGNTPQKTEEVSKNTDVYRIGESPKVTLQAKVNQEGVVEVIAQTPGIVDEVYVFEGEQVKAGQTLAALSTNYQGGNAPGLQASLIGLQYKNIQDTFDTQKELISKQREVAEKSNNNSEELRKISDKTEEDTRNLLNSSQRSLDLATQALAQQEQTGTPETIALAQGAKTQAQAAVNQLQSGLRNLEYSTNTDNPPTSLSNLQKDISLKQLDLQEKALELSRETSRISYNLALTQAALMTPASPFNGTVERVMVSPGESVNPGTVIAVISSNNPEASVTVMVPSEIANSISLAVPSVLHIKSKEVKLTPAYVSKVATKASLYTVLYNLPEEYISKVTNNSFIPVDIPVGYADTVAAVPFIPIDSVFQSQNASYVFVVKNGKAVSQKVTLGAVYGSYVEVVSGISNGDKVILNRTIVNGEKVKITN